jgi:hydroxymethylbilane synthase
MKSNFTIRIGTRESQLALWQATQVQQLLRQHGYEAELLPIKSDGDINLHTPIYEMGVQGVFTRSLDMALLQNKIDLAVHSLKDVPVTLAAGLVQAAVLPRGSTADVLVLHPQQTQLVQEITEALLHPLQSTICTIATSSLRRQAQWLHRFAHHQIKNLRGNVNTRLLKLYESQWHGAIFAAAGLERIGLLPANAVELSWMLPAPAQGAIVVVARETDEHAQELCKLFNDADTQLCTQIERSFLKALMGGCSAPISALATIQNGYVYFEGSLCSLNGERKLTVQLQKRLEDAYVLGELGAKEIWEAGGEVLLAEIKNKGIV